MDINEIIKIDEENKRADQNKTDGMRSEDI